MFTKKVLDYIGNISQIGGIKEYTFNSGKAKGMEAFDVDNGQGLMYTVLADKGLDICHLSYRGIPVAFISKTGIVSPFMYRPETDEWLRSFAGGFLTTCGLSQVGDPCEYEGRKYGLHGSLSNTPAEEVSAVSDWEGDAYVMKISGKVRQAKVQFENLVLKRTIQTRLGIDELSIMDEVTNEGVEKTPFMILYHMNFGYPFLNPGSEIVIPTKKIWGWDDFSGRNTHLHLDVTEPDASARELTYYHDAACDEDGFTKFMVTNRKSCPDAAIAVKYDSKILNILTQWMYLRTREYVMALEPCNNSVKGIDYESRHGSLSYIQPGETKTIRTEVKFLSSGEEICREKDEILGLLKR